VEIHKPLQREIEIDKGVIGLGFLGSIITQTVSPTFSAPRLPIEIGQQAIP